MPRVVKSIICGICDMQFNRNAYKYKIHMRLKHQNKHCNIKTLQNKVNKYRKKDKLSKK